jgi:hypothetical protein
MHRANFSRPRAVTVGWEYAFHQGNEYVRLIPGEHREILLVKLAIVHSHVPFTALNECSGCRCVYFA